MTVPRGRTTLTALTLAAASLALSTPAHATDPTPTTTTLSVSPNPATTGQTVTMTATVSPAPASNSVMLFAEQLDGHVDIICSGVNPVDAVFTCTTSSLGAGSHELEAYFNGTDSLAPSQSQVVTETVDASSAQASSLTLSAVHRRISYGAHDTLSGALTDDSGAGIAGQPVVLQYQAGSAWKTLATVTSSSDGTFSDSAKPARNTVYRASFAATGSYDASTSSTRSVQVAAKVTASASSTRTHLYDVVFFTGRVRPNERGQEVRLQRYQHHRWMTVNTAKLSRKSTFRIPMAATSHADYTWRVSYPATHSNAAGVSRSIKVTVR